MENKIELIRKIQSYHPGYRAGTSRGWSHYTGGFVDSGDWYFWKMYDGASEQELLDCLRDLEIESAPPPPLSVEDQAKQRNIRITKNGISNQLEDEMRQELINKLEKKLLWDKK